jgi:hypothetical protein
MVSRQSACLLLAAAFVGSLGALAAPTAQAQVTISMVGKPTIDSLTVASTNRLNDEKANGTDILFPLELTTLKTNDGFQVTTGSLTFVPKNLPDRMRIGDGKDSGSNITLRITVEQQFTIAGLARGATADFQTGAGTAGVFNIPVKTTVGTSTQTWVKSVPKEILATKTLAVAEANSDKQGKTSFAVPAKAGDTKNSRPYKLGNGTYTLIQEIKFVFAVPEGGTGKQYTLSFDKGASISKVILVP